MVKFSLRLPKGKSKDGSEASKDRPIHRLAPHEVDTMFDQRISKVFEDGIAVPVGPDGRVMQQESDVFQRSSSVRPVKRFSAMEYAPQRSSSSGRAQRRASLRNPFQETDFSESTYESPVSRKESITHDSLPNLAFSPFDAHGRHSSRERSRSRSRSRSKSRSRGEKSWHGRSIDDKELEKSSGEKKRKSKMEKIQQLQAKNDLYKEEFKRVQKDRKHLKKDLDAKENEIVSLTKEIDAHIAETSVLKLKLSEALQQLDRTDFGTRKDKSTLIKFNKELTQAQNELADSLDHIVLLKNQISTLQNEIRHKNQQIESLSTDMARQSEFIASLQSENHTLQAMEAQVTSPESRQEDIQKIAELQDENEVLHSELGKTLERAASMVKEREDAIADLLKENDDMKRQVAVKDEAKAQKLDQEPLISESELAELKEELHHSHATLEDTQDRNLLLEEEVESWVARGADMEKEIQELKDELETMTEMAEAAKMTISLMEENTEAARSQAEDARQALVNAEGKHNADIVELKDAHERALKEANDAAIKASEMVAKTQSKLAAIEAFDPSVEVPAMVDTSHDGSESTNNEASETAPVRQARLLEEAVASRRNKTGIAKKGWLDVLGLAEEEELTEDQKRIKELEAKNDEQTREINSLKSEVVRLRSTYNETMYTSRKRIETLETENEAHLLKVQALEDALTKAEI